MNAEAITLKPAQVAGHLILLVGSFIVAKSILPPTSWPAPLAAALAMYALIAALLPGLGWLSNGFTLGALTPATWWLIGGIASVSGVALIVWSLLASPDWASYREHFPDVPFALLIPGVVLFSFVNAAAEELAFRGVLQGCFDLAFGRFAALLLQAALFGLGHIHGFPSGASGVLLATIYGLMLGALRNYSGGLLAPWLAHVVADGVIVGILVVEMF